MRAAHPSKHFRMGLPPGTPRQKVEEKGHLVTVCTTKVFQELETVRASNSYSIGRFRLNETNQGG
jgi:hypothetical protein